MTQDPKMLEQIISILHCVGKLKKTVRYGYADNAANESVADHTNRVVFMAYFMAETMDLRIDRYKAMKMALIHDLGEYLEGDIDKRDIEGGSVSQGTKKEMEVRAFEKLKKIAPGNMGGQIYALWQEYEQGNSPEARYVRTLDRLESMLHLAETGHEVYTHPDMIPNHADKAAGKYPALLGMVVLLKDMLKEEFEKGELTWKETYDEIHH